MPVQMQKVSHANLKINGMLLTRELLSMTLSEGIKAQKLKIARKNGKKKTQTQLWTELLKSAEYQPLIEELKRVNSKATKV